MASNSVTRALLGAETSFSPTSLAFGESSSLVIWGHLGAFSVISDPFPTYFQPFLVILGNIRSCSTTLGHFRPLLSILPISAICGRFYRFNPCSAHCQHICSTFAGILVHFRHISVIAAHFWSLSAHFRSISAFSAHFHPIFGHFCEF